MATFTGQVASFAALKTTIETTLSARGWTLENGILSKSIAFVQLIATATELRLQAGTGQAAAALTGACPQSVKLLSFTNAPIQWPAVYLLHVFDTPDEIYVVLRYNVDRHQHLNWGVSSMLQIGGSGLWCSGTFRGDVDGTRAGVKVYIDTNTGTQLGAAPYDGFGLGFFFASIAGTYHSSFIHCGLEGAPAWRTNVGGNTGDLLGVSHKAGLLHALPSQFNQATVLLPIDVLMARQAQGQTIVATLAHARYCRLDHLDLNAPLIYGPERWMAYPLHALHPVQRNGVGWPIGGQHTGTFGIALRESPLMAALLGIAPTPRLFGAINSALSVELNALGEGAFAQATYARERLTARAGAFRPSDALRWPATGRLAHRFAEDLFDRIHVLPTALSLGNVVSELTREIAVWNAWRATPQTLTALRLIGDAGSTLAAPVALPMSLRPMQERVLTLTVGLDGPPVIDAAAVLSFADGSTWSIRIDGLRLIAWSLPPDWTEPVIETLAWLTDVQIAVAGTVTRTPLRDAPRRSWEFAVLADRRERRWVEHALFDWTGRVWALPVFVDTTWCRAAVPAGATEIPVATVGLDFAVGSLAMLWRDVATYELVEVAQIASDRIGLRAPTRRAWSIGTRLFPCRTARLTDAPELRRHNDRLMQTQLRFEATESCDWRAALPATRYRGFPVLEHRSDENRDPSASFARRFDLLDGEVGRSHLDDLSGLAWTTQSHAWRLMGRAERASHRSLLYGLQGRAEALWLPTWTDDLEVIETIGESAVTLTVAACGISRSLRQQAGRRHIRIELLDGSVFYRAIEASSEIALANGETGERLRMDAALGRFVAPERVRLACWMALVTLAGDTVELQHHADSEGLLDCAVTFAGVPAEEP